MNGSDAADSHFGVDHLEDGLRTRTLRGGAVTISAQAAKLVLQLTATIVLARLLTPRDFGLVVMVSAFTGVGHVLVGAGLSSATVQRPEIDHRQVSFLFWVSTGFGLLLAAGTVVAAPAIAHFYGEPRLVGVASWLATGFVFSGLGAQHLALLQRQMRFQAFASCELGGVAVGFGAAMSLAWNGAGFWALVAVTPVSALVTSLLAWIVCRWRPSLPVRGAGVRPLLAFGGHLSGFQVLNYAGANLDRVAVGWQLGAAPVGLYSRAYQLMLMPIAHLNAPLTVVALPALSRLQADPHRYRDTFLRLLEKVGLVAAPAAALAAATSDWLVEIVLGTQWLEAAPIFAVLAFVAFVLPVGNALGWLFLSQGRARDLPRVAGVDLVARALAIGIGLQWGAIGVAVALAIRAWIAIPLIALYACRSGPVRAAEILGSLSLAARVFALCLAALFALRAAAPGLPPLVGLAIAVATVGGVALSALLFTAAGRRAAADLRHSWNGFVHG